MSRVCPGCPQTSPREAGEGGCIRDPYGEHPGANAEYGMRNSRAKPPKATSNPTDCDPKATTKPGQRVEDGRQGRHNPVSHVPRNVSGAGAKGPLKPSLEPAY